MSIKLDLSKFKHHSSGKDSTTLVHEKMGHSITLAHKALSSQNREQLAALAKMSQASSKSTDRSEAKQDGERQESGAQSKTRAASEQLKETHGFAEGGKVNSYAQGTPDEPVSIDEQAQQNPIVPNLLPPEPEQMRSEMPQDQPAIETPKPVPVEQSPESYMDKPLKERFENSAGHKFFADIGKAVVENMNKSQGLPAPAAVQPEVRSPSTAPAPVAEQAPTSATQIVEEKPKAKPLAAAQPTSSAAPAELNKQEAPQATREQQTEQHKQEVSQDLAKENAAWQHDLDNGHITPETYQSLFAKKDTLGKISTIFGMLAAGIGAGIAGKENPLMALMQKQIETDAAAQSKSKENAQNFLKINQQAEVNKASIANQNVDTKAKAFALTQAQMMQTTFHHLVTETEAMAESPQKEAKRQMLGMMYSKIGDKIANLNDQAAAASAYTNLLYGNPTESSGAAGKPVTEGMSPEESNSEAAFQKRQQALRIQGATDLAKQEEEKHVTGLPAGVRANRPIDNADRKAMQSHYNLDKAGKDLLDYSEKHTNLNPGSAEYKFGVTKALAFQQAVREGLLGTVFRESEKPLLEKFVKENPAGAFKSFTTQPQLKSILESNEIAFNGLRHDYGLPAVKSTKAAPQSATIERVDPTTGKTVIFDAATKKPLRWK